MKIPLSDTFTQGSLGSSTHELQESGVYYLLMVRELHILLVLKWF